MPLTLLREKIESDLAVTLEGHFRLPLVLISPDGEVQEFSANDTADPQTEPLVGQILYDSTENDPETGMPVFVNKPVVSVRITSLDRVPLPTEKNQWAVKIPIEPRFDAPKETFIVEEPTRHGRSIGYIRLYCRKAAQGAV